jgi:cell division FtsZ-interacting protein ZapD
MTDFFDSDIVQEEAREMERLQMEAMQQTLAAPLQGNDKETQLEYIRTVRNLIEKQQIFYTRMKLSDDRRAVDMIKEIEQQAKMLYGWWDTEDVRGLMSSMLAKLDEFEKEIEAGG